MSKERKQHTMYTEMTFDNAQYAQDVMADTEARLARTNVGLIIGLVATICSMIALALWNSDSDGARTVAMLMFLAIPVVSIVSYIVGGGFKYAAAASWSLAKFGWFVVPIFPIDLLVGLFVFAFAIYAFLYIPLIAIAINRHQLKLDYEDAQTYLNYCRPMSN